MNSLFDDLIEPDDDIYKEKEEPHNWPKREVYGIKIFQNGQVYEFDTLKFDIAVNSYRYPGIVMQLHDANECQFTLETERTLSTIQYIDKEQKFDMILFREPDKFLFKGCMIKKIEYSNYIIMDQPLGFISILFDVYNKMDDPEGLPLYRTLPTIKKRLNFDDESNFEKIMDSIEKVSS